MILIVLSGKSFILVILEAFWLPLAEQSCKKLRTHSSAPVLCQPAGQELFSNLYIVYSVLLCFHESWSVLSVEPYFMTKSATQQEKKVLEGGSLGEAEPYPSKGLIQQQGL